ncbi:MAG: glycosyltransferase family 2 protein [Candidatus Hodarchaeota archaeon]
MVLVSIIIPAFNEELTIRKVLKGILEDKITNPIEIVVVDDGSKDKTSEKVQQFGVKLLRHSNKIGKGRALRTGMAQAVGEIIVWQDADLEYFPQDIPRLLRPIIQGSSDVVYGSRFSGTIYKISFSHFLVIKF